VRSGVLRLLGHGSFEGFEGGGAVSPIERQAAQQLVK
jgi:hypothetical protein